MTVHVGPGVVFGGVDVGSGIEIGGGGGGTAPGQPRIWVQSDPSASWVIPHTYDRLPLVDLYVAGELVDADITATDTTVSVSFPAPTVGSLVLG